LEQDIGWTLAPHERDSSKAVHTTQHKLLLLFVYKQIIFFIQMKQSKLMDPKEFATVERDRAIAEMMDAYNVKLSFFIIIDERVYIV
jgi:hypothetical protein